MIYIRLYLIDGLYGCIDSEVRTDTSVTPGELYNLYSLYYRITISRPIYVHVYDITV